LQGLNQSIVSLSPLSETTYSTSHEIPESEEGGANEGEESDGRSSTPCFPCVLVARQLLVLIM
jgi:hypothetical protein